MADWTKRNFEEIEDRSPAEVPIRWLFSRNEVQSEQVGVSRFSYEPGARMPFGHRHGVQEEVYVVVAGSGLRVIQDLDVCHRADPRIRAASRAARLASVQ